MKKCKVFSILMAMMFLFHSVSYADEKMNIPSDVASYTSLAVTTTDIVAHGLSANHDSENLTNADYGISCLLSAYGMKLHNQYAIYVLHKIGERLLNVQPKAEEESHEYQTFSRYPIEVYSLDELESYAQYVVKGRIVDEGQDMHVGSHSYTRTGFEISKVYRGDLEAGQTIYLEEPYYQEKVVDENYTRYYNGYTKSIVGDEYIFFLDKRPDMEEYRTVMASLSRYNLSRQDTIGEDVDNQSTKKVFNAENHSKIKEEVLQKYR